VSVASFLSKVCGTDRGAKHLKETAGLLIREGGKEDEVAGTGKCSPDENKDEIAGTDAVAILSSGLFGGHKGPATASELSGDSVVISLEDEEPGVSEAHVIAIAENACGLNIPEVEGTIASDVILPGDNDMSIGSSTDASPDHSTCGSSVRASESRKRTADESPDRDYDTSSRREFPGRVTRSAAGCRVYIPPPVGDEKEGPGRVLYPDGTIIGKLTLAQEGEAVAGGQEGVRVVDNVAAEMVVPLNEVTNESGGILVLPTIPVLASSLVRPLPALCIRPAEMIEPPTAFTASATVSSKRCPDADMPVSVIVLPATVAVSIPARVIPAIDEWGRDTCVINEVYELIEKMPQP